MESMLCEAACSCVVFGPSFPLLMCVIERSPAWGWITSCFGNMVVKESFGPRKENNSLKGPLLNHLTSEKTKQNFSSTLMLQAGCIYLGHIDPCPEIFHPLHLPRRLIIPCPTTNVISTKEYSKYPDWLTFPVLLPQTSLYKYEASLIPLGVQPGR